MDCNTELQVPHECRPPYTLNVVEGFNIGPVTALKLLCAGIEALVKDSRENPPTPRTEAIPTLKHDSSLKMQGLEAETEVDTRTRTQLECPDMNFLATKSEAFDQIERCDSTEAVLSGKITFNNSLSPTKSCVIIGENTEASNFQCSAIVRKFYSKCLPPISLIDYLMRIHKFCPMPTAVYLATSCYIHKLAVDEKTISVTQLNCHRLVLAGLRVTMKAFEDHSYAHSRFSKVGGVTASELARLEINFCFLINFDFIINGEVLLEHANELKIISSLHGSFKYKSEKSVNSREQSSTGVKGVIANA